MDDPPDLEHALRSVSRFSEVVAHRIDDAFATARSTGAGTSEVVVNEIYDDIMLDHYDTVMGTSLYGRVLAELHQDLHRVHAWSARLVAVLEKADGFAVSPGCTPAVRRGLRRARARAQELHDAMESFEPDRVDFRRWRGHLRAARRHARRTARICARCAERHGLGESS